MKRSTLLGLTIAWLTAAQMASADVEVAPVIGSNMVLQQNVPVPVWGSASANEQITIEFKQKSVSVTADALGHWQARLGPFKASAGPANMTVRGKIDSVSLTNILVGEVWLVSGQSNMEFPMAGFPKYGVHLPAPIQHRLDTDLATADCDNLRLFRMTLDPDKRTGKTDGWQACDAASLKQFSAVGYYFARELRDKLGVPVGILDSAVGGTRIEPWTPPDNHGERHVLAPGTSNSNDVADAGTLFTPLIEPLAPYALRGVLWYQGEANVLAPGANTYAKKMKDLIDGWRAIWGRSDLPFEYALLAPMRYTWVKLPDLHLTEESLPEFWDQQVIALSIPYTSMISTNDLVDLTGPTQGQDSQAYIMDLIHPGDKWDVAHRFALIALAKEYGFPHIVDSGPTVQRISRHKAGLKVSFENVGSGLVSRDGRPLTGFEIAGTDLDFVPATARIHGNSVIVTSTGIAQPAAIRFGWNEVSQPNLFNHDGLPAVPFRRTLSSSIGR